MPGPDVDLSDVRPSQYQLTLKISSFLIIFRMRVLSLKKKKIERSGSTGLAFLRGCLCVLVRAHYPMLGQQQTRASSESTWESFVSYSCQN